MTDTYTPSQGAPPPLTKDDLLNDRDFVNRWNAGDPAAVRQLDAVSRATVAANPDGEKPRPPSQGTGLLSPEQARRLAQASVDAGQDPATVLAALADTDPQWTPDTRSPADRQWAQDHEPGHPEQYTGADIGRHLTGEPGEVEAVNDAIRGFVASVGFSREVGSDLAAEITGAIAAQHGMRPDARAAYEQQQAAMLGAHREQLVKDAATALVGVDPKLVGLMHQAGALSSANVVFALASMAQARAVRS